MTDMKKCPYCGEDVKLEAIKCKHCQSMISEEDNVLVGAAAPARPQQAATKVKKPIWKRWWVWVAVVLIFFIFIGSMGGNDDVPSSITESPSAEDATAVDTPQDTEPDSDPNIQYISINETTTFAEWEYKVFDVQYHKTLRDERARGTYVVFMLEATNNSNVPRDIGSMFQIEDDKGRVFAFVSSASLAHHHTYRTDTWHYEDIGPSFTAIMPIAFDIPDDAKTLFLYPRNIRDEEFKDTSVIMVER